MKHSNREIFKKEIIGLTTEVIDSKNKDNVGIKGRILDETKNTIVIDYKKKQKRLFKNNVELKFIINKEKINVKAGLFLGRPKDRIKNNR